MEIKKEKQDIVTMVVIMIISALFFFIFIPGQIPLSGAWSGGTSFSSRTFPYILSASMFIVAAVGLANATASLIRVKSAMKAEGKSEEKQKFSKENIMKILIPFIIYALILIYAVLFAQFGFIIATIIIPPIIMLILGCKKWQLYLSIYIFAGVIYVIFKTVLQIPLP